MAAVVFAVAGPGHGRAGGRRWSSPDGSQMPALGERSRGGNGGRMVFGTCHHAVGGSRRDRAVEARREHRRGPSGRTKPGWSDHHAGQPAHPHQGNNHRGDRTRRLFRLRRGLLCARAHPRHRPCRGRGRRATGRGVRLHPRHPAGPDRRRAARAARTAAAQAAPHGRTGALRCWLVVLAAVVAAAWSPITSWPPAPLAAPRRPPARRWSACTRPPARTRPRRTRGHPPQRAMAHARW